jgi:hypothetical protein
MGFEPLVQPSTTRSMSTKLHRNDPCLTIKPPWKCRKKTPLVTWSSLATPNARACRVAHNCRIFPGRVHTRAISIGRLVADGFLQFNPDAQIGKPS